jgi:hypothetical protein
MSHLKMHGAHVRLADGRTGFVCGSGIDGLTVHLDEGRIVHAGNATVTVIPAPVAAEHPQPVRSAQRPIQTSHEPPRVENPNRLSILVAEKWSDPQ